jgi:hypothetical protein
MQYKFPIEVTIELPEVEEIRGLLQENESVMGWIKTERETVKNNIVALVETVKEEKIYVSDYYLSPIVNIE